MFFSVVSKCKITTIFSKMQVFSEKLINMQSAEV